MRKIRTILLVLAVVFSLSGCGKEETAKEDIKKEEVSLVPKENPLEKKTQETKGILQKEKKQEEEQMSKEPSEGDWEEMLKDTYWTAYELKDSFGAEQLPSDYKWIDLILRKDGTAQFREVQNELILQNDLMLHMTWKVEGNRLGLYVEGFDAPYVSGEIEKDEIVLKYYGSNLFLKQEIMPVEPGELLSPAQLVGTWILTSGMVEGWEWDAREEWQYGILYFNSIWDDKRAELTLAANYEQRGVLGDLSESFYNRKIFVLENPVYSGCGNEKWSIYLGTEMTGNDIDNAEEIEYYATLIDENTILLQRFFTIDGDPAVSYGYYKRILPTISVWEIEASELESTIWEVTGFTDREGAEQEDITGMKDFIIFLDESGICYLSWTEEETGEEVTSEGEWILGNGGGILLSEGEHEQAWFSGAVMMKNTETSEDSYYNYEMNLYYDGGILHLSPIVNNGSDEQ